MKKLKHFFNILFVTVFSVVLLSACGSMKTPETPEVAEWKEISYDELCAAYAAKEQVPWNHLEGTAKENDKTDVIVEDLVNGQWVVDETKSSKNRSLDWRSMSANFIIDDDAVNHSLNPTEIKENGFDYELSFYQKGNQYKVVQKSIEEGDEKLSITILDQYFYIIYMTFGYSYSKNDGTFATIVTEAEATWSIK